MLIGITGLAGSGKSEVARILMDEFGFVRVKFADPLKNMLRALLRTIGYDETAIERFIEGDLKESMIPELGVTSREAQKDIGTHLGRDRWGADCWAGIGGARADRARAEGARVLFDDVRFPNEAPIIRRRGGVLWRVNRPGLVPNNHPSERDIPSLPADTEIANHGTLDDLRTRVRYQLAAAMGAVCA